MSREPNTSHYSVSLQRAAPRTIAAVRARLAPSRVPLEFNRYLDQVYAARASGIRLDGQKIFVYRDTVDHPGLLDWRGVAPIRGRPRAHDAKCTVIVQRAKCRGLRSTIFFSLPQMGRE